MKKIVGKFYVWWFSIHSVNVSNSENWLRLDKAVGSNKPESQKEEVYNVSVI